MALETAEQAVKASLTGKMAFCKFLTANDTGLTGGHQSGIYIPKEACPILFDTFTCETRPRGTNPKENVSVTWQDGRRTDSVATYYGQGTRDEFRLTAFGRGFPYLKPQYTGALFVLVRQDAREYNAFVLNEEDDIDYFLDAYGISPTGTGRLLNRPDVPAGDREDSLFREYIEAFPPGFPSSAVMAESARRIEDKIRDHAEYIRTNPDAKLLSWIETEYRLFRSLEDFRYGDKLKQGFPSVEDFVPFANEVLNRRKSRAGKSLEHHLTAIFCGNNLTFTAQPQTEGKKRPDFIFPSEDAYRDSHFDSGQLIMLAAKTTCKDRWRQILSEADRMKGRRIFLCTLQQGMSPAQMDEMQAENVTLVVPEQYISVYPSDKRDQIWTLARFVEHVRKTEGVA